MAKQVWKKLEQVFDDFGLSRKVGLLRDFITTTLENCSSVEEYNNKVMSTAHKLRNINFVVRDEWLGTLLLAGVPDYYKPLVMGLESSAAVELDGNYWYVDSRASLHMCKEEKSGIQHQTSNSYTPEQNGLAERMNHTLVERAKCIILNAEEYLD
ncbi:hypothetical protein EVAR_7434_1 [Eumeta japonica]|uniref:Integrase catalytic domain-containing protein n=1 Tax=Eumeta variegata TaxID=151549 RepID=A0A4C1V6E8_EUMVA|nr:hypothetical protein EVAR_7434_1 [Eumeta japonica]